MDDEAPAGVPEWVVTYGDMMSLLLTFFIMLVSLSEVKADQKYRAILNALQRYVGYRAAPLAPPGESFPLNSLIARLDALGGQTDLDPGKGGVKSRALPGQDMRVLRTREGTALRVGDPILFAQDSSALSAQARRQLPAIAAELAGKPNKIEIRAYLPETGETGAPPAAGETARLQLSTRAYERARSVLEFLQGLGIAPDRIRITVASRLSRDESSSASALDDGPAIGQAGRLAPRGAEEDSSARLSGSAVEVLILDAFAGEFVGPREIPQ